MGRIRTRRGHLVDKSYLYKLLNNRVYIGEAVHKGIPYPGEYAPIISVALWDKVYATLQTCSRMRAG